MSISATFSIKEIRHSICGDIYPTSDPECRDPIVMQVRLENYCSSEKSCAEKICQSVGKKLVSYERCPGAPGSCTLPRAVYFKHTSTTCTTENCMATWGNDGSTSIAYSEIHCTGGDKQSTNYFF